MIEKLKEYFSIILIGIVILFAYALPIEEFLPEIHFENLRVPRLDLPKELSNIPSDSETTFPEIDKQVLLGNKSEAIAKKNKSSPRLFVKAIMIDGDTRVANINNRILQAGAYIYNHKVLKIEKGGVWIEGPSGKRLLKLR